MDSHSFANLGVNLLYLLKMSTADDGEAREPTLISVVRLESGPDDTTEFVDRLRHAGDLDGARVLVVDASAFAQFTASKFKNLPEHTLYSLLKPAYDGRVETIPALIEKMAPALPQIVPGVMLLAGLPLLASFAGQMSILISGSPGDVLFRFAKILFLQTKESILALAKKVRAKYVVVDVPCPETIFSWSIVLSSAYAIVLSQEPPVAVDLLWDFWSRVAKKVGVTPGERFMASREAELDAAIRRIAGVEQM